VKIAKNVAQPVFWLKLLPKKKMTKKLYNSVIFKKTAQSKQSKIRPIWSPCRQVSQSDERRKEADKQ
jgi:hypothetical protein